MEYGFKNNIFYLNKKIEYVVKFDFLEHKKYRKDRSDIKNMKDYKNVPLISEILVNNIPIFKLNRNSKEIMEERLKHYKRDIVFVSEHFFDTEEYKKQILHYQRFIFDRFFTDFLSNLNDYVDYDIPANKYLVNAGYNTGEINGILKEGIFFFQSDIFNIYMEQKGQFTINTNFNEVYYHFHKYNINNKLKKEVLKMIFEIFKDIYLSKNVNLFLDDMYNNTNLFKSNNLSFNAYMEKNYLQRQLNNF